MDKLYRLDLLAGASLLCGATVGISFSFIGQMYLAELMLPVLALFVLVFRGDGGSFGQPEIITIIFAAFLTFLGYAVSDMAAATEAAQYLRGWGRLGFLIIDVVALVLLAAQSPRYLWWFLVGSAVGALLELLAHHAPFTQWKIGYGAPISSLVLASTFLLPRRFGVVVATSMGLINIALDSRVQGAIILAAGAVLWARLGGRHGKAVFGRLAIIGVLTAGLLSAALVFTQKEYGERRADSNIGRAAGLLVGMRAIADSPFIGLGSWTRNEAYADMVRKEIREAKGPGDQRPRVSSDLFRVHSQIMQAWVEGGLLGATFFFVYGYLLVRTARWFVVRHPLDIYSPLFLYIVFDSLWHLLASPFGGEARLQIAVATAVIAISTLKLRERVPEEERETDSPKENGWQGESHYSVLQRSGDGEMLWRGKR